MNQNPNHTAPSPNSQAAAYGYKHAGGMASQGMAWRYTLTKPGYKAYGGSVSVGLQCAPGILIAPDDNSDQLVDTIHELYQRALAYSNYLHRNTI